MAAFEHRFVLEPQTGYHYQPRRAIVRWTSTTRSSQELQR